MNYNRHFYVFGATQEKIAPAKIVIQSKRIVFCEWPTNERMYCLSRFRTGMMAVHGLIGNIAKNASGFAMLRLRTYPTWGMPNRGETQFISEAGISVEYGGTQDTGYI